MFNKTKKSFVSFLTFLLCLAILSACNTPPPEQPSAIPDQVKAARQSIILLASDLASQLDGDWADRHTALLRSNQGPESADYEELCNILAALLETSGARYLYVLYPETSGMPENFLLTVDGSPFPDDWFSRYETKPAFLTAMNGTACCFAYVWEDQGDPNIICGTAFAPVHDAMGNVVCILAVDYPLPEMAKFPEWNKSRPQWNGLVTDIEMVLSELD